MEGFRGAWQQRGAVHSLAQGQEQATFAKSTNIFFSSSEPVKIANYEETCIRMDWEHNRESKILPDIVDSENSG